MGCVRGIAPPRKWIEQHIPRHMGLETAFQAGLHDLDHGKRAILPGYLSGLFACSGLKAMPDIASVFRRNSHGARPAFSADSRSQPGAGTHPARHRPPGDRPSRAGIPEAGPAAAGRHPPHLRHHPAGDHLSRLRHRRLGSGDRQYAVARRQSADGRDRPVRHPVAGSWRHAGASRSISCPATGAMASTPPPSKPSSRKTSRTPSRR